MINQNKRKFFLLVLIFFIVMIYNNTFYNFYYIIKNDFSERMTYHYGNCHHSGYGFIKNIHEKYNLNKNITTINYIQKPNSEWFFYNPNINFYEDKIIVLNAYNIRPLNDGSIKFFHRGKFLGNFKIIEQYENCYFIERIND